MENQLYMDGTKLNRHLEEVVQWQKGEWFAPIHLEISPSKVCNQDCSFCYIDWSHGKINMPEDMLIRLLVDAKKIGVKSVLLAGEGEPTVNPAYIKAIEVAGSIGLDIALNSNAVLFDEEALRRILPHLSWMRISVQASSRDLYMHIHDAPESHFDKVLNNLRMAARIKKENGYPIAIGVQQVLLKENAHDVANLAKLSRDLGVDYYVLKPCHTHEDNKYNYQSEDDLSEKYRTTLELAETYSTADFKAVIRWNFLNEKQRTYTRCQALPFIVQIGATGDVYTCYPMANRPEHLYGSLKHANLPEILQSKKFKTTCDWVADNVDVSKCMLPCRQHNANNYLWWLTKETPLHLNFI